MMAWTILVLSLLFTTSKTVLSNCYNKDDIAVLQTADTVYKVSGTVNTDQCRKVCWYTSGCHSVLHSGGLCAVVLADYTAVQQQQQSSFVPMECKNECEKQPCSFGHTCVPEGTSDSFNCFNLIAFVPPPPVPAGFTELGDLGVYIRLYGSPRLAKAEAEDRCQQQGAHLVKLDSQAKLDALHTSIKASNQQITSYIVVDGFDPYMNNTYYFWNGEKLDLPTAWEPGEPNSLSEQCLFIRDRGNAHRLYDGGCTTGKSFICEV